MTRLEAALAYASLGWKVFPIEGKIPRTPHGHLDATDDEATIRAWWVQFPDASIGVYLRASGLSALDIDPRNGGDITFAELERRHGALSREWCQDTKQGGFHLVFADPSPGPEGWTRVGGEIRGKLGPGVDVKANGYIVVEPSPGYTWQDHVDLSAPPPALPAAWIELLRKPPTSAPVGLQDWNSPSDGPLTPADAGRLESALRALKRDDTVKAATFQAILLIFHGYGLSLEDGWEYLVAWNSGSGVPHPHGELTRQVQRVAAQVSAESGQRGHLRSDLDPFEVIGRAPLVPRGATPPPPKAPDTATLRAHLREAKKSRKRGVQVQLDIDFLGRLLDGSTLIRFDEDIDTCLRHAAGAIMRNAPPGTTDEQVTALLLRFARPEDIAFAIRDARTATKPEVATPQAAEPRNDDELAALLTRGEQGVKVCGHNLELILRYAEGIRGHIRFNALTKKIEVVGGAFVDEEPNGLDIGITNWMEKRFGIFAPRYEVSEQLLRVVRRWHSYDPVGEYLHGLTWDGVPRIDAWLPTYCDARLTDDHHVGIDEYVRKIGSRFLIGAVARGLQPGCKVDTVLVFEGDQGIKKSTALKVLGGEWFSDTPLNFEDKDSRMTVTCRWIVELAELSSIKKTTELEAQKAFLSAQRDDFRPPYGRVIESFARRCVFAGTTNPTDDGYLIDETGNRRWWCVSVGQIDIEGLERDRDQLWAEATHRYLAGERWWFERDEQLVADRVARERERENPWLSTVIEWWHLRGKKTRFTTTEEIANHLGIEKKELPRFASQIGSAMKAAGFERRRDGDSRERRWYKIGE